MVISHASEKFQCGRGGQSIRTNSYVFIVVDATGLLRMMRGTRGRL